MITKVQRAFSPPLTTRRWTKKYVVSRMAKVHFYDLDDKQTALAWYQKLDTETINEREFNGDIACCYATVGDYDNALKHLRL